MTLNEVKEGITEKVKKIEEAKKTLNEAQRDMDLFVRSNLGLTPEASVDTLIVCIEKVVEMKLAEKSA
jgi:hypothetical protein